ncbi:MAG: glycerol kinase [Gammaproteobacteria bacterium]|nr:glycerol kinase [Gammaproteobacteria bacterium]NIR83007.1 glycerol kinase [Gammaproteobacteria bacterium]NIR90662.1 glycerol kinase [Gammaproteobacteria bacterium]NIU04164.1 glycerol kinase [Gammaproteobacteria bacterium]NIV51455.1 glycerol kinase [Gammaproteobacteria bacterium]
MTHVIAIDQGTTGTKVMALDTAGELTLIESFRHRQIYPRAGWVEHDPAELLDHLRRALDAGTAALSEVPAGLGLANQGETCIAWDARDGTPLHNAIVWQDDRTQDAIERLKCAGAEVLTLERAGLPLDPYFSASKLRWLLDHAPDAEKLLRAGRLRLGTSDAYFLERLTGAFVTDVTTASRTSLMNLRTLEWDPELCALFGVPRDALPEIRPSTGDFGTVRTHRAELAVTASVVDQQAALFGHGCLTRGDTKVTFGTGAFALANVGAEPVGVPEEGILSTVAWQLSGEAPVYAIDGGIYNAASAVEWLKGIGVADDESLDGFQGPPAIERGLAFVPALSGLGCPYWDRSAAGLWVGLGLETTRADLCRSVLEGVALRAVQLLERFESIAGRPAWLPVDGGLTHNEYFCRFLADAAGLEVVVPALAEITGLGAARMALLGAGLAADLQALRPLPPPARRYAPTPRLGEVRERFAEAVERARRWRGI